MLFDSPLQIKGKKARDLRLVADSIKKFEGEIMEKKDLIIALYPVKNDVYGGQTLSNIYLTRGPGIKKGNGRKFSLSICGSQNKDDKVLPLKYNKYKGKEIPQMPVYQLNEEGTEKHMWFTDILLIGDFSGGVYQGFEEERYMMSFYEPIILEVSEPDKRKVRALTIYPRNEYHRIKAKLKKEKQPDAEPIFKPNKVDIAVSSPNIIYPVEDDECHVKYVDLIIDTREKFPVVRFIGSADKNIPIKFNNFDKQYPNLGKCPALTDKKTKKELKSNKIRFSEMFSLGISTKLYNNRYLVYTFYEPITIRVIGDEDDMSIIVAPLYNYPHRYDDYKEVKWHEIL